MDSMTDKIIIFFWIYKEISIKLIKFQKTGTLFLLFT